VAYALSEYLALLEQSKPKPISRTAKPTPQGTLDTSSTDRSPGETDAGAHPETSDQSIGGRIGLANALNDPTSMVNVALDTMGMLAGPLGTIAMGIGKTAMGMHNNAVLNQAARNAPVGVRGLNADDNAPEGGIGGGVTGAPGPGIGSVPGVPGGTGPGGAPGGADAGVGVGPGDTGVGDGTGGVYHKGGMVRDMRLGMDEPITAQQGEFVIKRTAVKHYGKTLLEAINRGEADVKVTRKPLKDNLTR